MTLHSQRFATETLIHLSNRIPSVEIIMEYSVKPYRIDAYIPQYNIAIEIDENDHVYYDKEKEIERSRFITQQLRCGWIRVDNKLSQQETACYLLKQLSYYGITEEVEAEQKALSPLVEPPQKSFRQQLKELKEQEAEEKARKELEAIKAKQEQKALLLLDEPLFDTFRTLYNFNPVKSIRKGMIDIAKAFSESLEKDSTKDLFRQETGKLSYNDIRKTFFRIIQSIKQIKSIEISFEPRCLVRETVDGVPWSGKTRTKAEELNLSISTEDWDKLQLLLRSIDPIREEDTQQ